MLLHLLIHGLSPEVASGDAPTSSLEEIQSVLLASIQALETRMGPSLAPDSAYEAETAAPLRPVRRRLDFGGEAEPEAAAAACMRMPAAPEAVRSCQRRQSVAAAAAGPADATPYTLYIVEQDEPAAAAASFAHMPPATLDSPELVTPAASAASCVDMLPETLYSPEHQTPAASAASCADMLPGTLDSSERDMREAAAMAPGPALPFSFDFGDLRRPWAHAVSPDRAESGDTGAPDAAAGTCFHLPAGLLDSPAACSALAPAAQ